MVLKHTTGSVLLMHPTMYCRPQYCLGTYACDLFTFGCVWLVGVTLHRPTGWMSWCWTRLSERCKLRPFDLRPATRLTLPFPLNHGNHQHHSHPIISTFKHHRYINHNQVQPPLPFVLPVSTLACTIVTSKPDRDPTEELSSRPTQPASLCSCQHNTNKII